MVPLRVEPYPWHYGILYINTRQEVLFEGHDEVTLSQTPQCYQPIKTQPPRFFLQITNVPDEWVSDRAHISIEHARGCPSVD